MDQSSEGSWQSVSSYSNVTGTLQWVDRSSVINKPTSFAVVTGGVLGFEQCPVYIGVF